MGLVIHDLDSCAIAPVIDALIPDNYHFTDNTSTCAILDRVYQYLDSNSKISVEGAVMLLNRVSLIYREAISHAAFNRTGISNKNKYAIDAYCCDLANRCENCIDLNNPDSATFERDQITGCISNEIRTQYRHSKLEEYCQEIINAYNLRMIFLNYPLQNLQNRSDFSRKNVNYGN